MTNKVPLMMKFFALNIKKKDILLPDHINPG